MSVRIAKEELSLLMPNTLSHYFRDEPETLSNGQGQTLIARIMGFAQWLREMPRRRAVLNELDGLSARELADIGLSREEVKQVFEPGFVGRREGAIRRHV